MNNAHRAALSLSPVCDRCLSAGSTVSAQTPLADRASRLLLWMVESRSRRVVPSARRAFYHPQQKAALRRLLAPGSSRLITENNI